MTFIKIDEGILHFCGWIGQVVSAYLVFCVDRESDNAVSAGLEIVSK